ncbi:MAG: hypothetical protein CL678_18785 [Bdellovibrionaceae bacterium]|nr:hypothetical protein [Pseudobdellovibrionaceae bacterium]|tara:strand:- start:5878 stop:7038 length:1161 start_codon:yes stop_codon:yes gene_type:complete
MKTIFIFFLLLSLKSYATVDTHAHLFMKKGLTWAFNGDFFDPIQASSWKDGLSSQANPKTLNESGASIVVISLYANPFFTWDMRDSIRTQIKQLHQFLEQNPQWVLAKSSSEAQTALKKNKSVLILSLEGVEGILENDQDIEEFVIQGGIRIVTLLHLMDDKHGGAAFLKGFRVWANPIAFIQSFFRPRYHDSVPVNPRGLTPIGIKLLKKLIAKNVWIDLSHATEASVKDILPFIKKAQHPLLFTHTTLRKFSPGERSISESLLYKVKETNGIVGLLVSEERMLDGIIQTQSCADSFAATVIQWNYLVSIIGPSHATLGSDINGSVHGLAPPQCSTDTPLDQTGFFHIGHHKYLWPALKKRGAHLPKNLQEFDDTFLEAWSKVKP